MRKTDIRYQTYLKILEEELLPAMGCTEPIAVAYAAAMARDLLGSMPVRMEVNVSGNILKNVKSVVVPNTGGLRGIQAAAAAGAAVGQAERELEDRGLFSLEYKRQIPKFVRRLGVVTAPTGAAVRDIINIARRRNPYVQIILYPAIVQGDQAPQSIVNGIRALEQAGVDVMIVGRGGGSIEDLWAFNEEIVAQAIFDCSVPVISAVGHETDTTIADYVADLRAPTPSAGAELAVYDAALVEAQLKEAEAGLTRRMKQKIAAVRMQLQNSRTRLRYLSPMGQIREKRNWLCQTEERLQDRMERRLQKNRHTLSLYVEKLKGLSPLEKLNQGFSHVADRAGRTVTDVNRVQPGELLTIHVKNGRIIAEVKEKEQWKQSTGS